MKPVPFIVGGVGGFFLGRAISGLLVGGNADLAERHPAATIALALAIDIATGYACYALALRVLR